jgi:hypothetical protein
MSLQWLPLTEYSSKHRVSISTLRRRIKAKDIKFQLKEGRYLIADDLSSVTTAGAFQGTNLQTQRPSLKDASSPSPKKSSLIGTQENLSPSSVATAALSSASVKTDEPILTAANRLLTELKKAYTQILQEKEEQILHLKEEVTDLKTLVRVLESENQRLQRK